jgi:hypothetical protein
MIQYRKPIRNNSNQQFSYTFKDENGSLVDLSSAVSVYLELKLQGIVFTTVPAVVVSAVAGTVSVASYKLTGLGPWTAQFFAVDFLGTIVPGEPIQFEVVSNVEDLLLDELANY